MRTTTLALVALPLLVGCGGTTWINKAYKERARPTREQVLILPVEVHRLPAGLRADAERQLDEELGRAFGAGATSGLPLRARLLPAGYGNLSWQLARGMYLRGRHAQRGDLVGEAPDWLDRLPALAKRFLGWATEALGGAAPAPGASPRLRYLLAVYLDRYARSESPKEGVFLHLRLMCGLFDAQRQRTVVTTWRILKVRPTAQALRQALTGIGGQLRDSMAAAGR